MRLIYKSKRRHESDRRQPAPLPADARDPDIVHAHRERRRDEPDYPAG